MKSERTSEIEDYGPYGGKSQKEANEKYLKTLTDEQVQALKDESDEDSVRARTRNHISQGEIWAELDRRAKVKAVLPGTQMPDVLGRSVYGRDTKEQKDTDQKVG